MAIDTQEKRMNVVGVGRPWLRTKLPGANDEAWRIASGNAYGGNALTPAGETATPRTWTPAARATSWTLESRETTYTPAARPTTWTPVERT
jgi:hypothetical protein